VLGKLKLLNNTAIKVGDAGTVTYGTCFLEDTGLPGGCVNVDVLAA
jgi:hypothetical protein